MTQEDYYALRTKVKTCNIVLSRKCENCSSNKKCKEYILLSKLDAEKEKEKEKRNEQNIS